MNVIRVTSMDDIGKLREDWNGVVASNPESVIFQRMEWLESWWSVFGKGREMFLLAVYDGNRLVGGAPWYRSTHSILGWKIRCLRFFADVDSDYCQILAAAGREADVWKAVFDYLQEHRREWDYLLWREVPASCETLAEMLPRTGVMRSRRRRTNRTFLLPLNGTWEGFRGAVNKRMIKKFDRQRRLLGSYRLETYHGDAITREVADRLVALAKSIPCAKRAGSIFLSPDYYRFHCEGVWKTPMKHAIQILILYLGDTPAAYHYSFFHGQSVGLYNCSYNDIFKKISIGMFMDLLNIERGYAQGRKAVDFMRGDYWFKTQYNTEVRHNSEITLYQKRWLEMGHRLYRSGYQLLVAVYVRTLLPVKRAAITAGERFGQYLQSARQHGWKHYFSIAAQTVVNRIYRQGEVYVMRGRIREVAAAEWPLDPDVSVRELFLSDYSRLEDLVRSKNMPAIVSRFWSGDCCWGVFHRDALAGYVWVTSKDQQDRSFGIHVTLSHDEVYLYDGIVAELYRGRGLMGLLLRELAKDSKFRKPLFLTGMVDTHNAPMIKTMKKLNFAIEGKISRTNIFFFGLQKHQKMVPVSAPLEPENQPQPIP